MTVGKLGLEVSKALSAAVLPALKSAAGQATQALSQVLSSDPIRAIEAQAVQQAAALFATSVFQAASRSAPAAHVPEPAVPDVRTPESAIVPFAQPGASQTPAAETRIVPHSVMQPETRLTPQSTLGAVLGNVTASVGAELGGMLVNRLTAPSMGASIRMSEIGTPLQLTTNVFGEVASGLLNHAPIGNRPADGRADPTPSASEAHDGETPPWNRGATPGPAPASVGPGPTTERPAAEDDSPGGPAASAPGPQSTATQTDGPQPQRPPGASSRTDAQNQPTSDRTSASATGGQNPRTVQEAREHVLREQERMVIDQMMKQLERARMNMEVHNMMDALSDSMAQLKDIQQKLSNSAGY